MKIAVFVDRQGHAATLWQACALVCFYYDGGRWQVEQQLPVALSPEMPMAAIRETIIALATALPECKQVVARTLPGAIRAWLDGMGITMWQGAGVPADFLDAVMPPAPPVTASVTPLPQTFVTSSGDGMFYLDLRDALRQGTGGHTSRQVLMPLFRQRAFTQLTMICDHLPRWFADVLPDCGLVSQTTLQADGSLMVIITPQATENVPQGTTLWGNCS